MNSLYVFMISAEIINHTMNSLIDPDSQDHLTIDRYNEFIVCIYDPD